MSEFYRFLRPHDFNFQRSMIECLPHGGICFHVRPIKAWEGDMRIFVGFSTCEMDVLFNRDVARKVASNRLEWLAEPNSFSTEDIAASMHDATEATVAIANLSIDEYTQLEREKMWNLLERIQAKNKQAEELAKTHKEAVAALKLGERYDSKVQGR